MCKKKTNDSFSRLSLVFLHYIIYSCGLSKSLLAEVLNPLASVDERLNPRSNLVLTTVSEIPSVLPREDGTLKVRHHSKVTAVCRADTSYVIVRAVRVARIL